MNNTKTKINIAPPGVRFARTLSELNKQLIPAPETLKDGNEIIDCGKYVKIFLYNKQNNVIAETIIDKKYYKKARKYRWHIDQGGYVVNTRTGLRLHHIVLKNKKWYDVDHINHNRTDNRRCNLRYLTRSENSIHRKKSLGVYWNKYKKRWIANIMINYKRYYLGSFKHKDSAIKKSADFRRQLLNNKK